MSATEFRLPNITAGTSQQQLQQMQSFLVQHIRQLNFAMGYLEGREQKQIAQAVKTGNGGTGQAEQQSPQGVFNSIKSLIIKSADIVDAYYEEISTRLSGEYVAQSEFGTFKEETEAEFQASSTSLDQVYTNVQTISGAVGTLRKDQDATSADVKNISGTVNELYESQIATSAYIRTGLLGYDETDGSPIYGMEVGQTNTIDGKNTFDKMARFTAGRMSFYDANDIEVAYVSDYKLYITNAHITGNLIVGYMELDTTDGLVIRDIRGDRT